MVIIVVALSSDSCFLPSHAHTAPDSMIHVSALILSGNCLPVRTEWPHRLHPPPQLPRFGSCSCPVQASRDSREGAAPLPLLQLQLRTLHWQPHAKALESVHDPSRSSVRVHTAASVSPIPVASKKESWASATCSRSID